MKKSIQSVFFALVVLSVLLSGCAPASTPTAIITLTPTQTVTSTPSEPFDYTVQEGDSLEALALRFNLGPDGALLIYNANREVMEANNGIIFVGQTIKIPPPGSVLPTFTPVPANLPRGTLIEYSVLPGDTLAGIAVRFNSLEEDIIEANEIENANALQVGDILQIPVNLVTATATLPSISMPVTPTVAGGTPTGTPIFPPLESFVGIWQNIDSNTSNWTKIEITRYEDTLSARFWGACSPTDCDAGVTSARYSGNPVLMFMDAGFVTSNFTLSLNGDTLHVTTFDHYTDNSGRADMTHENDFRKVEVIDPSFPVSEQIVFYHFVQGAFHFVPGASVLTPALLFPAASDEPHTSETAADLRTALELVLQHERNGWISSDLEIVEVTFRDGHADIVLQGEYSAERDELLNSASLQILLTVFANPAVQTAAVTLNGDTIGNLGVSTSTNAKPADYVYTRAEMETYLQRHAYMLP